MGVFLRNKIVYRRVFKKEFEKFVKIFLLICSKRLCILRFMKMIFQLEDGDHVASTSSLSLGWLNEFKVH